MTRNVFVQTVRGITAALLEGLGHSPRNEDIEKCSRFCVDEYDAMGIISKLGITALMLYLNFVSLIRYGKLLFYLPAGKALGILNRWRGSRIHPKAAFFNFFFMLTTLAYYDARSLRGDLNTDSRSYAALVSAYNSINHD